MPAFTEAQYDGESERLLNPHVRVDLHRRPIGWGWGEIYDPSGGGDDSLLAVLEHFGEIDAAAFPHPLQLVATDVEREVADDGERLHFDLALQDVAEFFDYEPHNSPVTGDLTLHLPADEPTLYVVLGVETTAALELAYVRGPWLRVGAESFGADRDDGIFPGLEWVVDDEWSSGTDHVGDHHAMRVTPHPNTVSVPTMAVGTDNVAVGLSWNGERTQPVYATPNFVDRQDDSLLGLMYPTVAGALEANDLRVDPPVQVASETQFVFDATVSLSTGLSLDVVVDWVRRNGLPQPPEPRYDWGELVDWIAEAYDTNLWTDGEGFGVDPPSTSVPEFVSRYIDRGGDEAIRERLEWKRDWCERREGQEDSGQALSLGRPLTRILENRGHAAEIGDRLLALQTDEGSFTYDPEGRHEPSEVEWVERTGPLGQPGETELGLCTDAAGALLVAGSETDDATYVEAAGRALDFAEQYTRPAGDDWWETPIHGPNLFAAGKSAIAYYLGHEATGKEGYRERAVYWLRSMLPFTHLWTPADREMRYNTKPCFAASYRYAADWTTNHVQWEVLSVFEMMDRLGIDWTELDPNVDWDRYHRGITTAALRWMIDSRDADRLERFRYPDDRLAERDAMYTDIFNPVEGWYGGPLLEPSLIGVNAMILQERA